MNRWSLWAGVCFELKQRTAALLLVCCNRQCPTNPCILVELAHGFPHKAMVHARRPRGLQHIDMPHPSLVVLEVQRGIVQLRGWRGCGCDGDQGRCLMNFPSMIATPLSASFIAVPTTEYLTAMKLALSGVAIMLGKFIKHRP